MMSGYDDLKLHIYMFGGDHEIPARFPTGPAKVLEMLPLARGISEGITAVAIGRALSQGEEISCRAGCGECCSQLVPIAPAEAVRLADVVEAMPEGRGNAVRKRFDHAVRRLRAAGLVDRNAAPCQAALRASPRAGKSLWEDASRRYFDARIPCPFLEEASCSVYPERPMVCREYNVSTPPSLCATLSPDARTTPRPVRMSEVMTEFTNKLLGRKDFNIPLTLSLDWARANKEAFEHEGDGKEFTMELVRCIQACDDLENA